MRFEMTASTNEDSSHSDQHSPSTSTGNGKSSSLLIDATAGGILKQSKSSLGIKVPGGEKTTTPPKQKRQDSRTLHRRLPDDVDQKRADGADKDASHFYDDGILGSSSGATARERRRRSSSRSESRESRKQRRRRKYDSDPDGEAWKGKKDSYKYSRSNSKLGSAGKRLPGHEDVPIPIGQWVVILCVLLGLAVHHFGGKKFKNKIFGWKASSLTNGKDTARRGGKKSNVKNGGQKKKKGGGSSNRGGRALSRTPSKKRSSSNLPSDSTTEQMTPSEDLSPVPTPSEEKQLVTEKPTEDAVGDKQPQETPENVATATQKKKKKVKVKVKKKSQQLTESNENGDAQKGISASSSAHSTPDSISTDGSSSTRDGNAVFGEEQQLNSDDYNPRQNGKNYEGEWTTVGGSSSRQRKTPHVAFTAENGRSVNPTSPLAATSSHKRQSERSPTLADVDEDVPNKAKPSKIEERSDDVNEPPNADEAKPFLQNDIEASECLRTEDNSENDIKENVAEANTNVIEESANKNDALSLSNENDAANVSSPGLEPQYKKEVVEAPETSEVVQAPETSVVVDKKPATSEVVDTTETNEVADKKPEKNEVVDTTETNEVADKKPETNEVVDEKYETDIVDAKDNDQGTSSKPQHSEEDDAALARMLQQEEVEMARAASTDDLKTSEKPADNDCWEEVPSRRKKGRRGSSGA